MVNRSNKKKSRIRIFQYFTIILFFAAAIYIALNFNTAEMEALLQRHEKTGLLVCFLMYGILGLTLVPSEPVTLLVLGWKGPVLALVLATLGNTVAAIVEYYIGGSIGDLADFEKKKENLPFHLDRLPINSPAFLFLVRMIPAFGPKLVSVAGGIYKVPMITYLWTAVTANFLGAAFITLGGMGIFELIK